MPAALKPSLNWLLPLAPIAIVLRFVTPEAHIWLFFLAGVAIIPIAGWMGKATEHLAARTGEGIGGLLNATFGNMAELIIAIMALREGLTEIVKASLTGSIIGNALLILGASMLSLSRLAPASPHTPARPIASRSCTWRSTWWARCRCSPNLRHSDRICASVLAAPSLAQKSWNSSRNRCE